MRAILVLILLLSLSACSTKDNNANKYIINKNGVQAQLFDQGKLKITLQLSDFINQNFAALPCFIVVSQHEYSIHLQNRLKDKGFAIKDITNCQNIVEFEFIADSYHALSLVAKVNNYMITRYYQKSGFEYYPKTPFNVVQVQ